MVSVTNPNKTNNAFTMFRDVGCSQINKTEETHYFGMHFKFTEMTKHLNTTFAEMGRESTNNETTSACARFKGSRKDTSAITTP